VISDTWEPARGKRGIVLGSMLIPVGDSMEGKGKSPGWMLGPMVAEAPIRCDEVALRGEDDWGDKVGEGSLPSSLWIGKVSLARACFRSEGTEE